MIHPLGWVRLTLVPGNQHELFSRLHFDGARYKEHLIPLAALGEFQAYDGAVRAACRFLFLSRNPNRKRFGFDLELVLGVVEEGSALSAVNRRIALELQRDRQAALFPAPSNDPHAELFHDARDMVTELVFKMADSKNPTAPLKAQLEQLATLEEGWDDDDAPAPSEMTMKVATATLIALGSNFGIPDPFIYPTYEGAVRAEWPALRWNLALEVLDTKLKLFAIDRARRDPDSITHFTAEQVPDLARVLSDRMRETA